MLEVRARRSDGLCAPSRMMDSLEDRLKSTSPGRARPDYRNIFGFHWRAVRAQLASSGGPLACWRWLEMAGDRTPRRGLDAAPLLAQSRTDCREELARPLWMSRRGRPVAACRTGLAGRGNGAGDQPPASAPARSRPGARGGRDRPRKSSGRRRPGRIVGHRAAGPPSPAARNFQAQTPASFTNRAGSVCMAAGKAARPAAGLTRGREQSLPDDEGSADLRHPLRCARRRSPRPCPPFGGASTYRPLSRSHTIARVQGTG